jgi:predicted CXXCH cytochrome family protein
MACARIDEFACHDPHGNTTNISLLKDNVKHPHDLDDTLIIAERRNNYSTPHIYDTSMAAADEAKTTDRWCAAACHQIGKRTGEKDWSHAFMYVRKTNDGPYNTSGYDYGTDSILDLDIYDTGGTGEPSLDNTADINQDAYCSLMHSSYNRVPGDANYWTDKSEWAYDTNYKLYMPAKTDSYSATSRRFVCFTCHDPHGTKNQGMLRYKFVDDTADTDNSELCLKCHIFQ